MLIDLPKITMRQKEILDLLYEHRFLNRIQIQALLNQKDYKNTNLWLKDLREKHYVEWIYSTHFAEKTKPAVYYLDINAIRRFKQIGSYERQILKYYRESTRSQAFIDRCILLADACIAFKQANRAIGAVGRKAKSDDIWFMEMQKLLPGTGNFQQDCVHFIHIFTTYLSEKDRGHEFVVWLGEFLNKPENKGRF